MNEYADAMEHYFEAKRTIESVENFEQDSLLRFKYVRIMNQLGVLNFKIDKFDEAIEYLNDILSFMQEQGLETSVDAYRNYYLKTYINIGAIFIRKRKFTEAEVNYTKALAILDDSDKISYTAILNNLGIIAKEQEDYSKAFQYHEQALRIRLEESSDVGITQSYNNLGATYFAAKDYDNAKINFEKSLEISLEKGFLQSAVMSLDYLKQIFELRNDFEKAYSYQSDFQVIKDSLMNEEKFRAITQMELQDKFDTKVRESQFRQEKIAAVQQRKETIYILVMAASLLGALVLVLIFFLQRGKMKRQLLETKKNTLEVKSLELEKQSLERELEFRTKELTTNVMYMARTSEFITRISEKLLRSKMHFTKENQEVIHRIITELQSYVDQDTWTEFELRFQQVHNDFYSKLNELHPDLTANEKKLCAFLRLNMTTKEISAITYQSANSIIVARSRLRKKLGIERDENLVSHLENL
jgi:tetratricopeptide (TPR) repeat protein/DNA-binding CsgD family transcriptional regulator